MPAEADFPVGFLTYTVQGIEAGVAVQIELILPPGTQPTSYFKYGRTADNDIPHWYEFVFDGRTGAEIAENVVTLHFRDGERGDDDLTVNSQIRDPGAPAVLADPDAQAGPIALDLNLETGDQEQRQTTETLEIGDQVVIDIVAVSGAQGAAGFQVRLKYDPAQIGWVGFQGKDIFATGAAIPPSPSDGIVEVSVAILGGTASRDDGSLGHATFRVLEDFTGETKVEITSASYDTAVGVGSGGATVVVGGILPTPAAPTPDFDGDGTVGFIDFIQFAQRFGSREDQPGFDPKFDLDSSGDVGFTDFIQFAQAFGKSM